MLSSSCTNWSMMMWLTLKWLLDFIQQLLLMLFTPRVFSYAYILEELYLVILLFKNIISSLLEARIASFCSLATLRVVVGSLILASQSHYVSKQLDISLIMLSLENIDSTSFLKSASNIYVTIDRWKYINTFL